MIRELESFPDTEETHGPRSLRKTQACDNKPKRDVCTCEASLAMGAGGNRTKSKRSVRATGHMLNKGVKNLLPPHNGLYRGTRGRSSTPFLANKSYFLNHGSGESVGSAHLSKTSAVLFLLFNK